MLRLLFGINLVLQINVLFAQITYKHGLGLSYNKILMSIYTPLGDKSWGSFEYLGINYNAHLRIKETANKVLSVNAYPFIGLSDLYFYSSGIFELPIVIELQFLSGKEEKLKRGLGVGLGVSYSGSSIITFKGGVLGPKFLINYQFFQKKKGAYLVRADCTVGLNKLGSKYPSSQSKYSVFVFNFGFLYRFN